MKKLTILSLGAGVQSSCMAIMAARGDITPMPDAAIFADTRAEPKEVMEYLEFLEGYLPFKIHRVSHKDGLTSEIKNVIENNKFLTVPFFSENYKKGSMTQLKRQCTADHKIKPIIRKCRELLGYKKGQTIKGVQVEQWIGISLDEIQRMKPSRTAWIENRWPLIDLRMKRHECLNWLESNGFPKPPRSACTYCPYKSDREWREMKLNDPDAWKEATAIDNLIRQGTRGRPEKLYAHKSGVALEDADFSTEEDRGQTTFFDSWNNDCEGMCGV
jgi:hypothetical protein